MFCVACTSVMVKPDDIAPSGNGGLVLKAVVRFDGNPDYLPATIAETKDSDTEISYEYKVLYDGTNMSREVVFGVMPTTLLGFPTGLDDILVVARLDIQKGGAVVKSYSSEAMVKRPRSIFLGGADKTKMRRKGLLAVKENLENQMIRDRELLSKLNQ